MGLGNEDLALTTPAYVDQADVSEQGSQEDTLSRESANRASVPVIEVTCVRSRVWGEWGTHDTGGCQGNRDKRSRSHLIWQYRDLDSVTDDGFDHVKGGGQV